MKSERSKFGLSPKEELLVMPDGATTVAYGMRGLNWKGKIGYRWSMIQYRARLDRFYKEALAQKECYYGPFKGEFGHFLLHNLPFLVHLHQCGVEIHYCGMELHRPFLVDSAGASIIAEWYPLRDFFAESKPNCNETVLPADVSLKVDEFKARALASGAPFLDIAEKDLYWFMFRNWQLDGKQGSYNLASVYGNGKNSSCVIFPRKKGAESTPNNGGPWDYSAVARAVAPYFKKVYFVGHPSLSASIASEGDIEFKVSENNADTLRYCAEASLIITQHSGAVHIGSYVDTPVLLIFKGTPPIKGLIDTIRFRKNLKVDALSYVFSLPEIENFVSSLME